MIKLYNPILLYSSIWIFSLFLYSLDFTNNIIGLNSSILILVLTSIFSFILNFFFIEGMFFFNKKSLNIDVLNKRYCTIDRLINLKKILNKLLFIWISFTIFEIFYFKGIPFFSVVFLGNYDLDYTKFGIPTLHGLLNSCYFTISVGYYLHYKVSKDSGSKKRVLILLIWPFLVMSRATLLWVLLEIFYIYLLFSKVNLKKIFSIFISILLFVVLFGYIGDSRNEKQEVRFTDNFIKEKYKDLGDVLPTGFVWVYLYATTPINNLVYNIEFLSPKYDFRYSFSGLIPSFIKDKIFEVKNEQPLKLYQEAFNVSSYFANYLSDFGIFGTIIFVIFLQIIILIVYFSSLTMKLGSVIAYSSIFYAIITSVFFDNFMSLVTIFQVLLGFFINYLLYSKKYNNYGFK
jgi:oligosaccharide repeat unit polymerase